MALQEIVVHVESDAAGQERLALARALADEHGARLVGVGEADAPPQGVDEWRPISSGRDVEQHARYADLTVIGQAPAGGADHLSALLLKVGRPLLAIPRFGRFASVGKRVLVAWNGSREATRAVFDALPLLKGAERVTVMTLDAEESGPWAPGDDISLALARHGVAVETVPSASGGIDPGNALLSRVADLGADMLVMGGFGHSPLRERVLGGVTRSILGHMTVPVFMSH